MTLQQIYYALVIADTGSMNKAAEKLFISQPALTGAVRELEEETGIEIFGRTNRGVRMTPEGSSFLSDARRLYQQYLTLSEKYNPEIVRRQKFNVSIQHYSAAVKAFIMMVREYDPANYEFAIREEKTMEVVRDVSSGRADLGVLFRSDFNKKVVDRILREYDLEFFPLTKSTAYVYLYKDHPLAGRKALSFDDLKDYICLSFEQESSGSAYLSEEIMSDVEFPRHILVTDRSTMQNLIIHLNGYTLCSGLISEDLNDEGFCVIPFQEDEEHPNQDMSIGYVIRRGSLLNKMGQHYVAMLKECFRKQSEVSEKQFLAIKKTDTPG